jgi:hypothetical protein
MIENNLEIKYQSCLLMDALHRNINDRFYSVSFEMYGSEIQVKIILSKRTDVEDEYIDDLMAEFIARQDIKDIKKAIVDVGQKSTPLGNIVYQKMYF